MRPLATRLRMEQLEGRNLLAPWPFELVNQAHPIMTTYGQYLEGGELGIHLHEGVDIPVAANALAVEAGQIVNTWTGDAKPYNGVVIVKTGPNSGWNYIHVEPGKKPAANEPTSPVPTPWAKDNQVKVGDVLGRVVTAPFGNTHLHLDRGGAQDPSMETHDVLQLQDLRRPVDDPLNHLVPLTDTIAPVVSNDWLMRRQG
jgi:hypothetical protein